MLLRTVTPTRAIAAPSIRLQFKPESPFSQAPVNAEVKDPRLA
jgi:hypothetical protein